MISQTDKSYERLQLFSGGGSRFGYYLGSYAALVDHDLTPDVIVGTCGGSLSALLVQIAPDPKQLQELACSRELYNTIKAIRHVSPDEASIGLKLRYSTQALKRWQLSRNAAQRQRHQCADNYEKLLAELQQLAMFRIDNEDQWLDELLGFLSVSNENDKFKRNTPDIAIIASRLKQASDSDIGAKSAPDVFTNNGLQLQELLFAPKRLLLPSKNISGLTINESINEPINEAISNTLISPAHAFANGRIHQSVETLTQWDFSTAVRASMADMYYLPPTHIPTLGWCLGGVINLTPIELACQLATTVFAETKAGYDPWLAAPAIKRVFGFDPNERLAQVHGFSPNNNHPSMKKPSMAKTSIAKTLIKGLAELHQDELEDSRQVHWLPFADNGQKLAGQQVKKRFNMKQLTIELLHSDYDGFVKQMQAQWQYGYQRTANYIQQQGL